MSLLFAWISTKRQRPVESVLAGMGAALRSRPEERQSQWTEPGFGIGCLERPAVPVPGARVPPSERFTPVERGPFKLWIAGEIFHQDAGAHEIQDLNGPAFRERVLNAVVDGGLEAVRELDGEFWVALWNSRERVLQIANDRFGGLPLYYGESLEGAAVAGGVRGVLIAPGIPARPDPEAIREAVTFGGFRLGGRTNAAGVEMLGPASVFTLRGRRLERRRYWSYRDIAPVPERPLGELYERADALWTSAIAKRLHGAGRFGQTLSGGLDSRAILAEGAPRKPAWAAITYGVPRCDDVRYARRAAAVAGADWQFYDLYRDPTPDWLASRSHHIQRTDGLTDLFDLMHVESVGAQAGKMDVHLSGYIGDAVCGPTFANVASADDVFYNLPYYGELSMPFDEARARVHALVDALGDTPPRFALFENKLPQATNRWPTAWRPWLVVRKPFVDYALFDFWQGLPIHVRVETRLYERWLLRSYPHLFSDIPNQKTGVPILTPEWRYQLTRAVRFAWRKSAPLLAISPSPRNYHDASHQWRAPLVRRRIEETVLHRGSISAEILGRERLASFLAGWFERQAGATQIVAALYVYEHYHRELSGHLRAARREALNERRALGVGGPGTARS